MDRSLFFDGQDVQEEDLTNVEDTKVAAILRRGFDFATTTGIITGLDVTNPLAFTLEVAAGVAYDSNGEAIVVTAPTQIVVAAPDVGDFLVIRHTETDGTPVEHPVTGVLNNTRRVDGFQLAMETTPAVTDVVLAELQALDGGGTATLDVGQSPAGPRVFWSARLGNGVVTDDMLDPTGDVITHINTFGTGTVTGDNPHGLSGADIGVTGEDILNHQILDHSNGIEGDSGATAAIVSVNSAPAPDQLNIAQLTATDTILVKGVRLTDDPGISPTTLTFGAASVNPALYWITLDSLNGGTVLEELRAEYQAAKNITGVQVLDVSDNHVSGIRTLSYDQAFQTLSWDSGDTIPIDPVSGGFNGDRQYKLTRGAGLEEQFIVVHVDHSALPGANQTDSVQINNPPDADDKIILASVPWSGSATGFLGFGDQGASGVPLDKRPFGNVGTTRLTDEYLESIHRTTGELRPDGWVLGQTNPLNGITPPVGADAGGLNFSVGAYVVYVGGERFERTGVTLGLTDNALNYIYADATGTLVASTDDPEDFLLSLPERVAIGWEVTTAGGVITVIADVRVDLFQSHDLVRSQGDSNNIIRPRAGRTDTILRYRDEGARVGNYVDYLGYNQGYVFQTPEFRPGPISLDPFWDTILTGSASIVDAIDNVVGIFHVPVQRLTTSANSDDAAIRLDVVSGFESMLFSTSIIATGEWIFYLSDVTATDSEYYFGFSSNIGSDPQGISTTVNVAYFFYDAGTDTLIARTRNSGGVATETTLTSQSIDTAVVLKMVVFGASNAGGARIEFFVNGVLEATHTTNLPAGLTSGNDAQNFFTLNKQNGAGASGDINLARMRLTMNMLGTFTLPV